MSEGASRIDRAFAAARSEGRMAIAVYLTVGYPERDATVALARAAIDGGADVIELGVPFSDPLADGATVQRASESALRAGVTLVDCIRAGTDLAHESDAAILLMGYTNPFLQHGFGRLATDLAQANISGVIVPDLPAEESAELDAAFVPRGLARVDLYAPTTPDERLARLLPSARGFVYCVALTGVTGARSELGADAIELVRRVRPHTTVPIVVGFGISTPAHVRALRGVADGVAVGSAALNTIASAPAGARADSLRAFVRSLREAGAAAPV